MKKENFIAEADDSGMYNQPGLSTGDISKVRTQGKEQGLGGLNTARLQRAIELSSKGMQMPAAESEQVGLLLKLSNPIIQAGMTPALVQLSKRANQAIAQRTDAVKKDLDVPTAQRNQEDPLDPNWRAKLGLESVEEEIELDEDMSALRNAIDKMNGGDKASTQQAIMAITRLKSNEQPGAYSGALWAFIKPYVDSLEQGGTAAVNRYQDVENAYKDKEPQAQPEPEVTEPVEPQTKDNTFNTGERASHSTLGDVTLIKTNAILDADEIQVQSKDGALHTVKKSDMVDAETTESIDMNELRKLAGLSEAMSDMYGDTVSEESEDKETVTYSKTKKDGDSTVTVSANADSMEELHKVLQLAGITLPKGDSEPEAHDEPEVQDEPDQEEDMVLVAPDSEEGEDEMPCGTSDADASYSTDKEVLVNYLKDKLKKSIS